MSRAAATDETGFWSPRRVVAAGMAIVAVGTVTHAVAVARTWFYLDDFTLLAESRVQGLSHLLDPYFGHVMPLGRLLMSINVSVAPLDYRWLAGELLVFYVATCVAVLRLLVTLVGARAGILLPFTCFAFSSLLSPAMSWWAAGVNHLPALLFGVLALDAHVRHLRSRERRPLVLSVVWIVAGLAFAELTLLAYLPIAYVTVCYFAEGGLWPRLLSVVRGYRTAVITHSTLATAYVVLYLYLNRAPQVRAAHPAWSAYVANAIGVSLPSAVVGGPGRWQPMGVAFQMAGDPQTWVRVLGLAVLGGLLTLTAATRDRGLRAWTLPPLQVVLLVGLLGYSRSWFGPSIALDLRYFTPVAFGLTLSLTLAFLPILGAVEVPTVRAESRLLGACWAHAGIGLATSAFATASLFVFPLVGHTPYDPRSWFEAVKASVARHPEPVQMVDGFTPSWVIDPPYGTYRNLFAFGDLTYPAVPQDDYYQVDEAGQLYRPRVHVVRHAATPVPDGSCGYRITGSGSVPLDGPIYGYGWYLELRYDASMRTPAVISVGDVSTPTTLLAGRHRLLMHADAQYDAIRFTGLDPAASVCVRSLRIGTLRR